MSMPINPSPLAVPRRKALARLIAPQHRLTLARAQDDEEQFWILRMMAEELRHGYQMFHLLLTEDWSKASGGVKGEEMVEEILSMQTGSHVLDALLWWLGDLTVESYEDDACGGVEAECRIKLSSAKGVAVDIELSRLRRLSFTARVECERPAGVVDRSMSAWCGRRRERVARRSSISFTSSIARDGLPRNAMRRLASFQQRPGCAIRS